MALALSVLGATCFFAATWGINASGVGRHDAGMALFLSFASVILTYVCAAQVVVGGILLALALARGRPWRTHLGALLAAALPIAYLAFR